jgi:hypothetical protein
VSDEIKNVFVSHIHEDDADLTRLKDLLGDRGVAIRDSSINSLRPNQAQNEDYIKSQILAPNIRWAGTFVVLISPETKNSAWVDWEINYAQSLGKKIVGIWAQGAKDCDVPDALQKYSDSFVGWHGDSIKDAICSDAEKWEQPDGTPAARQDIARFNC